MQKLSDSQLADLLAELNFIDKVDRLGGKFGAYAPPMSKMSYLASELVRSDFLCHQVLEACLRKDFKVSVSRTKNCGFLCTISDLIDVQDENMNRAILEACATILEGAMLNERAS